MSLVAFPTVFVSSLFRAYLSPGTRAACRRARSVLAGFVLIGLVVALPTSARADSNPVSVVVFQLDGPEATRSLRTSLTSTIREVVTSHERYDLVNRDPVTLSDMIVLLGCNSANAGCLEKTADQLGAQLLVFGRVEGEAQRKKVVVKLFDAARGRYLRSFGRVMSDLDQSKRAFRDRIHRLLKTGAEESETQLKITSNVDDARVEIDGESVGRTPVERSGLSTGRHEIRVSHPEYRDWTTVVELGVGTRIRIRAPLENRREPREETSTQPTPLVIEEAPAEDERTMTDMPERRETDAGTSPPTPSVRSDRLEWHDVAPWLLVGGGLVTAASGLTKTLQVTQAQRDLRQWRNDHPNDIPACVGRECEILERGRTAERDQWILFGVGGAVALGGLVWWAIPERTGASSSARRSLRIGISPRSISARIAW